MNPDDLIHRLHEVIDTALWDSFTVEEDRAVGRAEVEACEAERREAEAVRDEVTTALRRLADVIEYTGKQTGPPASEWEHDPATILQAIDRIARGEDTP